MKTLRIILAATLVLALATSFAQSASNTSPQGTLYVLAVGIKQFKDGTINALEYTEADATALTRVLQSQQGKVFAEVKPYQFLGTQATRPNIEAAMNTIAKLATPPDTVVAYFSTHGQKTGDDYFLLTQDTQFANLSATALSGSKVLEFYKNVNANTLLLLDTCFSGVLTQGKGGVSDSDTSDLVAKSVGVRDAGDRFTKTLVTSATGSQKAWECNAQGQGCFTAALLEALDGKGGQGAQGVTLNRVVSYLAERVPELASTVSRERQQPTSTGGLVATWTLSRPTIRPEPGPTIVQPTPDLPPAPEQPQPATGVFVSSSGSDASTGTAKEPVSSLGKALELNFEKINISGGEYSLPSGGFGLSRRLNLLGQGVTLRCEPGGRGHLILGDVTLVGIRFVGCATALSIQGGNVTLNNVTFEGNRRALEVVGNAQVRVSGSRFSGNGALEGNVSSIKLGDSARLELNTSTVENSAFVGVAADNTSTFVSSNSRYTNNSTQVPSNVPGRHIYLTAAVTARISGGIFEGGTYSVVTEKTPGGQLNSAAQVCGVQDNTERKSFQTGSC